MRQVDSTIEGDVIIDAGTTDGGPTIKAEFGKRTHPLVDECLALRATGLLHPNLLIYYLVNIGDNCTFFGG